MYNLTKIDSKFVWNEELNQIFERLKKALVEAPVLGHPNFDLPFVVQTDASDAGLGAVLTQIVNGEEKVKTRTPTCYPECQLTKPLLLTE